MNKRDLKKILIIGGGGFIGKKLCENLVKLNYKITRFSSKFQKKKYDNILEVQGKITDEKLIRKLVSKSNFIIHLSSLSNIKKSFTNLDETFKINIQGTFNVLKNISSLQKKPNFIFISSSLVYGNNQFSSIKEKSKLDPATPFAMTKVASEIMCRGFYNSYQIPITILRPFTVYGPNGPDYQLIPKLLIKIKKNAILKMDNPNQIRDCIFIDDVVNAIIMTIKKPSKKFRIYNIGTGKGIKNIRIAEKMIKIFPEYNMKIKYGEISELDSRKNVANIDLIRKEIGWEPATSFSEGLKKTILM